MPSSGAAADKILEYFIFLSVGAVVAGIHQ
jgi:hypothetical protein